MNAKTSARGPVILLIDDERDTLIQVSRMLQRFGFHVLGHSNPDQVIDLADARRLQFDLLLTDMDMQPSSKLSGMDLIVNLRCRCFDQPMILWSGGDNIKDAWIGADGASLVLSKGASYDLIEHIRKLLGKTG